MNVLVTGGCGYVGSIVSEGLVNKGHNVYIIDNLQQGHRDAFLEKATYTYGDFGNASVLEQVFSQNIIDAVVHMAAETVVEYSMTDPGRYFRNNIAAGIKLLDSMLKYDVKKIIFSSSASVYGEPVSTPIDEDHPKNPINSYGETKLMFEHILKWYGIAYGLKHISMRYFNAAGASEILGEDHRPETHLIPNILRAVINSNNSVSIFGTDYPTRDGSCLRDYVHVKDIAQAHILALEKLDTLSGRAYNLGSGEGYTVLEVVEAARNITGLNIPFNLQPRRAGDPSVLVASSIKARTELGWNPEYPDIKDILETAWQWMSKHPDGYEE
ncbi:MAG: UDP-glucose 4-epimerase GalE [Dehalococcoidales bacterium]|nr:UDP-glucose 4-epimerase GalE [Dehalococcoidales bacterium]